MLKADLIVLENELIARRIYRMVLQGPLARSVQAPGQFIHIRCGDGWETVLRRPISIASWSEQNETVTIIYRVEGKGTSWLAKRTQGEAVDALGPLGNGFPTDVKAGQRVVLIGGGVGVPPLYGLAQRLMEQGAEIDVFLGFASHEEAFLVEAFSQFGTVKVATDDGTLGSSGRVTDLLPVNSAWDAFYTCGPMPMLRTVQQHFTGTGIDGYVSLEQRMGCGIGACLACVCPVRGTDGQMKICSDGPVFPYMEVALG